MASGRDLEANLQQILQMQVDAGLDPGFPLSETLDHLLCPNFQPDDPAPGQPPSNVSQQADVILILAQTDASAARVLQEILSSPSQNRPIPPQSTPPGQSAGPWPYTMPEDANQDVPSPSIAPASSPSQVTQHGAPTDTSPQCPVCRQSFGRPQERDRHILTHLPLWLFCPFPGCEWRGDRPYTLPTHWTERHTDFGEAPKPEDCKIYNPVPLVQSVIRGELPIEEVIAIALQEVAIRAQELDKLVIWEDEWGRVRR